MTDADTVVGALARRRKDVSRFVREAGSTAAVAATRREELAAAFHRLPAFLGELDPYMLRLGQLSTAQQPVLRDLRGAAGDLDTFLTRLPPFADAGTARRGLSWGRRPSPVAAPWASRARSWTSWASLAREAPGLAKPLRQLLESIDNRKRAVNNDPRAAATAPPAPDPTHISGQGGFTGMEAIWDYFYWQALATNPLDDIGHVLRLHVGFDDHAPPTSTTAPGRRQLVDKCKQWLGPRQPGINEPEPAAAASAGTGSTAAAPAGTPATPSTVSRTSRAPSGGTPSLPAAEPVLDYLLGP